MSHLLDLWSAQLRGTRRFAGASMARHLALPGLDAELFRRWLATFGETTAQLGSPAMKAQADARTAQIAERFWHHYRLNQRMPPGWAGFLCVGGTSVPTGFIGEACRD